MHTRIHTPGQHLAPATLTPLRGPTPPGPAPSAAPPPPPLPPQILSLHGAPVAAGAAGIDGWGCGVRGCCCVAAHPPCRMNDGGCCSHLQKQRELVHQHCCCAMP
eukprot:1159368-Pelagomonas_calceolata.AAC.5